MSKHFSGNIHVFGGTSDAVQLCQMLESLGFDYSLSVATEAGEETAAKLKGEVCVGRLDALQMKDMFCKKKIDLVIDATHPFAVMVSQNICDAVNTNDISLIRYERLSQIDEVNNPLLIKVDGIDRACEAAKQFGSTVFLTTGSKNLSQYVALLPEKRLIARVLPTVDAIQSCVELGLGLGDIVAVKGPFAQDFNRAMYRFYQPDVVITKESGTEGGYLEKVQPCLHEGIPCIVICRPKQTNGFFVSSIEALKQKLKAWS